MRRIIGGVGRALVTVGILILLFVAYQLWGTGFYEAQQQKELKAQFNNELVAAKAKAKAAQKDAQQAIDATTTTLPQIAPPTGDAVAIIEIPKIGLDRAVVQGIGVPDLRRGPGHYPLTPLPGQIGNAAIAGHRTTYGAPFNRIDELAVGDPILIRTLAGTYRYNVTQQLVVSPKEVSVLDPTPNASLTLTTCNPKFSASQRLVVKAVLDKARSPKAQKPPPEPVVSRSALDDALSGRGEPKLPTIWYGFLAALVGGLWWLVFHRYHRWTTWFVGAIPFAVVLFVFYYHLERLLPGNY
jgi:sortase A